MNQLKMQLPWPPSVNHYWRHPTKGKLAGRHLISAEGRQYRKSIADTVLLQAPPVRRPGWYGSSVARLEMVLQVYPPDRRKRDLDNLLKAIKDSLGHAGVYGDDSQIDRLVVMRMAPERPSGMVIMVLQEIETTAPA